ncbi:hypothetical protein ABVT39_011473 [Epinephelus coioides]
MKSSNSAGIVPEKTKIAITIYKSGEKNDKANYRPISFLPTLSKILERVVYIRLSDYLSKMPHGKSHHRPEAAKRRMAERRTEVLAPQLASSDADACCGTGWCHKVHKWPIYAHSGRQHKLVIPVEVSGKKVFIADLVPRLTVPGEIQEFFRQEFHRVSTRLGVKYFHHADRFPLNNRKLCCRDGVHLSDDMGMPILVESLLAATKQHLEIPSPKPQVARLLSPKPLPKVVTNVIVVREVAVPRAPAPEWTSIQSGRKRNHSEHEHASGLSQKRVVHHVVDGTSVALRECFMPLNPVRFSPDMLVAMEEVAPSAHGNVSTHNKTVFVEPDSKPMSLKHRPARKQDLVLTCAVSGTTLPPCVATHPVVVSPAPVPVQAVGPDVTVFGESDEFSSVREQSAYSIVTF